MRSVASLATRRDHRRTAAAPRVAHLTTVDMSLFLLLRTELVADLEAGCEVIGISAPGSYVSQLANLGIRHVAVPSLSRKWAPRRDLAAVRELARVLRAVRPDVLHTHTPKAGVLGRIVGRAVQVPIIVNTCHGLWASPDDRLLKRALVYAAEALAGRFSDAELYQNGEDRQRLRHVVGADRGRTVGNGIDLARFRPDPVSRARTRAELGITDGELLVGGVGRRVAEKGIVEFAMAARALSDSATFVWVGPQDEEKRDRIVQDLDAVRFIGPRADMEAVYPALDVFVLPSYREGFSRSAMEAAASGCAMVLTDIRGCREIGRHDEHLLLVPARDPVAVTGAVARLLDDADLRARLGRNARHRALQEFDQRRVADLSLDTYRRIADRKGLPWCAENTSALLPSRVVPERPGPAATSAASTSVTAGAWRM